MTKQPTLTILIPTRNRANLANAAISSIMTTGGASGITVIVSDNSTDASNSSSLARYIEDADYPSIRLIKPPLPMSMTEHWEWAITQAINETSSSHFSILTDRMLFRPGELDFLLPIVAEYPDEIISYTYDRILDHKSPVTYQPLPRSGNLLRLDSAHLLNMAATMRFASCFPRMLNSIAPRAQLQNLRDRYGSIFDSVSPDYCYCFRSLTQKSTIVYYDKSILISYAHDRSNGANTSRGTESADHNDFVKTQSFGAINRLTPVPALMTVGNAVVNEYNFVRERLSDRALPEISTSHYLNFLAAEVRDYEDNTKTLACLETLKRAGWKEPNRFTLGEAKTRFSDLLLWMLSSRFKTAAEAIEFALSVKPLTNSLFSMLRGDLNGRRIQRTSSAPLR